MNYHVLHHFQKYCRLKYRTVLTSHPVYPLKIDYKTKNNLKIKKQRNTQLKKKSL